MATLKFLVSDRLALAIALLISALAIGITIRTNTYVAWGTDSSAYLDGAAQWAKGDLFHPTSFMFWAPWSLDGNSEAPFGRVPGATRGTIVNVYPPGYSLLLAAALKLGGPLAPHVVSPIFLGVLAGVPSSWPRDSPRPGPASVPACSPPLRPSPSRRR
jgi:hypothetical protein